MKISIDIDGTFNEYPEFFQELTKAMQAAGHKVGLLTARHPAQGYPEGDWDFIITSRSPEENHKIEKSEAATVAWKKKKIQQEKIDFHFDDIDGFAFKVNFKDVAG